MRYGFDIIQMAYEITVNATTKPSIAYANTILERWYNEGYKTTKEIEQSIADYRRKKATGSSSFEVDDFFEAALQRTYGE